MTQIDTTNSAVATISNCKQYRYDLRRMWDGSKQFCCWIMLNPSTADAVLDDPTIRRCIGYAKAWGYGGIQVVNLFALRSTDPSNLYTHHDPKGPQNDDYINLCAQTSSLVVAGWGVHGAFRDRGREVARLLKLRGVEVKCLGVTKDGHPKHPLYLKSDLKPILWKYKEETSCDSSHTPPSGNDATSSATPPATRSRKARTTPPGSQSTRAERCILMDSSPATN